MNFIPYGRQDITEADIEAVVRVLRSDFLTQGPAVEIFEAAVCRETGAQHAVACSSGTAALHLAVLAAKIGHGDRVIVPPITFVASANCARYAGAEVLFADIDSETLNISPQTCRKLLEQAVVEGRPVKAVVTVDLAGHPCDMQAFALLKKEFNFIWIQDACHSLGATWEDNLGIRWKIGEWPEPDMTVFSFHPVKHITTGEGGMIVTHSEELANSLRVHRSHGIVRDVGAFVNNAEALSADGSVNPWYYEMQQLGFNYRLSDIQAALGCSQIERLGQYVVRRREIAASLRLKFEMFPRVKLPIVADGVEHAYHLCIIRIDFAAVGATRAEVMKRLKAAGIGTQVHYIPIPMMPFYAQTADMASFPAALAYYREALSIPCFPKMTDIDVERVCSAVISTLS